MSRPSTRGAGRFVALLVTASALLQLALAACGKNPRPEASPAPIEPSPAPQIAAPAPEPDPTPEQLPLEDDFSAQAEQEITAQNYRAALDAIEREMKADSPHK